MAGLRERLANPFDSPATGCARLELHFAGAIRPAAATLGSDGILRVAFDSGRVITLECAMDEEVGWIEAVAGAQWQLRPACETNSDDSAPLEIQIADGRGFIWETPDEDSSVIMVREREQFLFIATAAGETEEAAKAAVSLARQKPDINPIYHWKQYWRAAPRVFWPDAQLQKQWNMALFKQARFGMIMGFVAAIGAFLARSQDGEIHVLPAIPRRWRELSFDTIRCEGGFIIGADITNSAVIEVRVRSEKDGVLQLLPNAQTRVEREMTAGETWVWHSS